MASENNADNLTAFQKLFFEQAKSKIGVDAVYFLRDEAGVAKIPLIYFSMLEDDNAAKAAHLHSLSWNMGEAPQLFIVTPTELKIYNNYQTPQKKDGSLDPEAGLIDTISLLTDLETQRRELAPYNRMLLESGEYWRRTEGRFSINTRIDTTLMNNLRVMRRRLIIVAFYCYFFADKAKSAHRSEVGRWALRYMFSYSSMTSTIILAPSLKPFRKIRQSVIV